MDPQKYQYQASHAHGAQYDSRYDNSYPGTFGQPRKSQNVEYVKVPAPVYEQMVSTTAQPVVAPVECVHQVYDPMTQPRRTTVRTQYVQAPQNVQEVDQYPTTDFSDGSKVVYRNANYYGPPQQNVQQVRQYVEAPQQQSRRHGRRGTMQNQRGAYEPMTPDDNSESEAGYDVDEGTVHVPQKQRKAASGYSPRRQPRPEYYQQGVKYVDCNVPQHQPRPAPVQEEIVYKYKETPSSRQQVRATRPVQAMDTSAESKAMYDFNSQNAATHSYASASRRRKSPTHVRTKSSSQQCSQLQITQEEIELEHEWKDIRGKIDTEYQNKLKHVNDEAMRKLHVYQKEHKDLLEKTQYLYESEKRARSRASNASLSRVSRQSGGSRARSRGNQSNGNVSNLSFISYKNKGRNRFFKPRPIVNQPSEEEPCEVCEEEVVVPAEDNETKRIVEFYHEFQSVVRKNVTQDNQIYLVDVLEQLHFLDDEAINDTKFQLCNLLRENQHNLMIFSKSGEYTGESEDIIKNFFKFCCAVQNFKLKMRGHNQLDDKLLKSYVGAINYDHDNADFVVMDQINTLKSLVNRKAYCLSHAQIQYIHQKYVNMFKQRSEWLNAEARIRQSHIIETPPQQYRTEAKKVDKNRVLQSAQPKNISRQRYQEVEPTYQYKEVRCSNEPAILYQETASCQKPQYFQTEKRRRPWSGVRPQNQKIESRSRMQYDAPRADPQSSSQARRRSSRSRGKSAARIASPQRYQEQAECVLYERDAPTRKNKTYVQKPMFEIPPTCEIEAQRRQTVPAQPRQQQSQSYKVQYDRNNASFGPQERAHERVSKRSSRAGRSQNKQAACNQGQYLEPNLTEDEPICVLKIELDGQNVEEIKVYENDDPRVIVQRFGKQFNLSDNAKRRLLDQILEQIALDDSAQQ